MWLGEGKTVALGTSVHEVLCLLLALGSCRGNITGGGLIIFVITGCCSGSLNSVQACSVQPQLCKVAQHNAGADAWPGQRCEAFDGPTC